MTKETVPSRFSRTRLGAATQAFGCGMVVVIALVWAVGGAFLDNYLVAQARSYCDAGWEPPHKLELLFFLPTRLLYFPVAAVVSGIASLLFNPLALWSPLGRWKTTRAIFSALAILVALTGPALLLLHDFATLGTLDGYPGDSGLCPPDNVPPWWPSWLPS
ncbi:hypothetical protein DQ384_18750 [Sphaerisporangium album]|uniref:Uncharacterized protein n=1 Tax=Sphaerisporangium album TaxID=509200 RepID=A0A367FH38_9ACTN|nr:hypothetical protein [Sphaerisporangium album]RCG29631.1 hypothetical protein DQ384_18750 [Sphaerisporangium album]